MKLSNLIQIENISKTYPNINSAKQRFKSLLSILFNKNQNNGSNVLTNIKLNVKKGESLAIIGKNGAGKSTLLKIISGVIPSTTGTVNVNGKIGALLELGSGFHPEYTGRENLKMSAALAGIESKTIDNKIHEMVKFADIGEYIDQPVKNYSSGMVVRLGFSVVTVTKPDLLITDEVLAVGDTDFQRKCIAWIDNYLKNGGTLLLVSHSIYHVQKLCKHALWLENGKIKKYGDSFIVSQEYQNNSQNTDVTSNSEIINHNNECKIKSFKVLNTDNKEIEEINSNEDIILKINLISQKNSQQSLNFEIKKNDYPIYTTNSSRHKSVIKKIHIDEYEYIIKITKNQLLPAEYKFIVSAVDEITHKVINKSEKHIKITSKTHEMGVLILDTKWN